MKKLITLFALLTVVFSMQAQNKEKEIKRKAFTIEEATALQIKKMVLDLDLTPTQQKKIELLIKRQVTDHRERVKKRREIREQTQEIRKEKAFKKREEILDKRIAFQKEMKSILDDKQYESFKEMTKKRERMIKRKKEKHRDDSKHQSEQTRLKKFKI